MWKLQGLGKKVGFGGLKGVFPSLPTSAVGSLGCKTRQKMKAGIRKIVKHTHTQFSGGERTWACVWHRKYFSVTWVHGALYVPQGEPWDDGVLWSVKPPTFLICSPYNKPYRVYMIMVSFRPKTENLIKLLKVTQLENREGLRPKQTDSRALDFLPNNDEARIQRDIHQHL